MSTELAAHVAGVRQFNRFYTRQIGLLRDGLLGTPFSLTEARVLYELAQCPATTAAELATALTIDPGYLSRLLRGFMASGLVARERSAADRRQSILTLTDRGRDIFTSLDQRSQQEIGALLDRLDADEQRRLLGAMATIETLLDASTGVAATPRTVLLRSHRADDLGWVLARHATLYAKEYGWGSQFKLLVAGIVADFLRGHDPDREDCWIAERAGEPAGSVMLVDAGNGVAKLRLLLVEPRARGFGIGRRLVDECIRFARNAGYRKITLWTQSILVEARAIYQRAGFVRIEEKPHCSFGVDLMGETWELEL